MPLIMLIVFALGGVFAQGSPSYYLPPDVVKKDIYHDTWIDLNKNGVMDPYENPNLPVEKRVEDLLNRMTIEEKVYQLQSGGDLPVGNLSCVTRGFLPKEGTIKGNQYQRRAIEETRLGIPVIIHDEALHGCVARGCTSFPQAIGLAATWDPQLMYSVAKIIGRETRTRGIHQVLSPVVNIARDIRGGRTEETYGEDPYLTGVMGAAFCQALREEGVIATPKHYAANFVGDGGRDSNEIHFSERILREIYFPGFHSCFKAGALSVMSAYNSLDGIPCTSNNWLLNEVLKWEWGFPGFVVSDYGSAAGVFHAHHVASTLEEAAKLCLEGGLDVELPGVYIYGDPLLKAIQEGMVSQKAIDEAVRRVLRAKFLIGLFDKPYANPDEAETVCGSPDNAQVALEAARRAIVLLKNDGDLLPLDKNKIRKIAVLGPCANQLRLGGYSGEPPRGITPLEGIRNVVNPGTEVVFVQGCNIEIGKVYFNAIPSGYLRTPDGEEGLRGEYFSNRDFQGSPDLVRVDKEVNFDWGTGAPAPNLPSEDFSVRWTGKLIPPETRTYEIYARTDDGVRLWIDGKQLIDTWHDRAASTDTARISLEAGKEYDIKIEFYEHSGFAVAQLGWDYGKRELPAGIYEAAEAARNADVAVIFAGIIEGEGQDRAHIDLPGFQEELINEVLNTGTPTVVVLIAGSAVTGDWIDRVPAILMAWYPGQEGGTAIGETLFGISNPGGKLPITWPRYVGQLPLYHNFKPTGRGYDYVDMSGSPLFPFGHGLSYSNFAYSNLRISANEDTGEVEISFDLRNVGERTADEVAQLYIHDVIASAARPLKELKRFKRVTLAPGENTSITFHLTPDDLAFYDVNMRKVIEPGEFEVMIGSSSADIRLGGNFNVKQLISTSFECSLPPLENKIQLGKPLKVSLLVRNKGTISDLCPVSIYLDGNLLESHKLDLASGEKRTVDFRIDIPKRGKHEIEVAIPGQRKKASVEVTE